jgi:hypothetical protein
VSIARKFAAKKFSITEKPVSFSGYRLSVISFFYLLSNRKSAINKSSVMKKFTALLILLTAICSLTPFAQTRGKTGVKAAAETLASETNEAMSAAWKSGVLPVPSALPSDNPDESARILAEKVAARNEESVPALLTALRLSGFFITDKKGEIFLAPGDGKGQGLVINGWEAASAAKMYGAGRAANLAELGRRLQSIPEFGQADIANALLEGVRRNAESTGNTYLRFWARFIVELGKNSADKYDILSGATAEQVSLDAIQHLVLMRRLYGDIFALGEKYKPDAQTRAAASFQNEDRPQLVKAGFSFDGSSPFRQSNGETYFRTFGFSDAPDAALPADEKQIPCRMDGLAPIVMDATALAVGVGFGELTGYLEQALENTPAGDKLGKFTRLTGIMNILLAYAKFIQTYASLESKIVLEDAPPLIRTKNAVPGERKNLRTEVRVDIGNWQMYNCIRTAMNVTTGIDFATLNDGPLGDVGIRWHLDAGGAGDVYSNAGGITGQEQIVGFAQPGAGRIQNKGTSAGTGAGAVKDITYTKTDSNGIARITLEGSPQKNFKSPNAVAVTKQAKVRTTIRMKTGEIKGDMVDIAGQVISGIPGLITMPAELLYRMDWASVATLTVPVRDWEDCGGKGWNGTVEVSYRKTESRSEVPREGPGTYTYDWSYTYDAVFNIKNSPAQMYGSGSTSVILKGDLSASAARITDEKKSWSNNGSCGRAGIDWTSHIAERGSLAREIDNGFLQIDGDRFKINFRVAEIPATRTHRTTSRHYGWCGDNPTDDSTSEGTTSFSVEGISIEGAVDPNDPNRIEGSKSYTDSFGHEVTIRWSLRNCR